MRRRVCTDVSSQMRMEWNKPSILDSIQMAIPQVSGDTVQPLSL